VSHLPHIPDLAYDLNFEGNPERIFLTSQFWLMTSILLEALKKIFLTTQI
jgi:hypothetical protein